MSFAFIFLVLFTSAYDLETGDAMVISYEEGNDMEISYDGEWYSITTRYIGWGGDETTDTQRMRQAGDMIELEIEGEIQSFPNPMDQAMITQDGNTFTFTVEGETATMIAEKDKLILISPDGTETIELDVTIKRAVLN